MKKSDRKALTKEWSEIMRSHPTFARSFLVQQAILMKASVTSDETVTESMVQLVETGLPVLFKDFWTTQDKTVVPGQVAVRGLLACLADSNRDPRRCFPPLHDFFDDPLAGGQVLPPRGPNPHR